MSAPTLRAEIDRVLRVKARHRLIMSSRAPLVEAIVDAIEEHVQRRLDGEQADTVGRLRIEAEARAELEHAAGYRQGHQAALVEAATMLKRHGHRAAVTRVLALADEAVQTPARPQPVNASPAGGPGPSEPQDGIYDYGTRTWHPVPTPPENGAQRGVQGLQGAIDAASDAERERRERDAWVGHAPTSPRPRTYAARLAAAGDEARDD